jgi:hypothetical protein
MTIENEDQLRSTYEHITKMYQLCDRIAADTTGHPSTREAEIDSIKAMIRKLERQIVAYVTARPERAA